MHIKCGLFTGCDIFMENLIVREDVMDILKADLPWPVLFGSSVLISGAAGFLPAYMVECLAELNSRGAGIKVLCLVRDVEKAKRRLGHLLDRGVSLIKHDISNPLPEELPLVDFIIHAASQASPKYYGSDPVGTLRANTLGTAYLLDHAVRSKSKKFLFFSSGEVYGTPLEGVSLIKESDYGYIDPTNVRSCYAESKRVGETMCVSWAHQHGVPTLIVRPFHTYGPGFSLDDGRVFADFISAVVNKESIQLNSDGSAVRPFCYLSDAIKGYFTVLLKGEAGEAYNVANPNCEISIKDLAYVLADMFGDRGVGVLLKNDDICSGYIKTPVQRILPSVDKIKALGWTPEVGIKDGFMRTVRSFL